ncbi:MAG: hypothetical protein PHT60_15705 [Acidiphilium sp.]|nr:hypothetical protein [Acidiphilium sp.]MDD4937208.1 hypothetical protein [Acidiphilium sp.]
MADEAHRSQYGFRGKINAKGGDVSYGFAKYICAMRCQTPRSSGSPARRGAA